MRPVDMLALDATYWQPIDWKCRDCNFELHAANCDQARMPAVGHYITTGHQSYQPIGVLH